MADSDLAAQRKQSLRGPRLERSLTLIWFCDRIGPESQVATWNVRHGGIEAVTAVFQGRVQLAIATPAQLISQALEGKASSLHTVRCRLCGHWVFFLKRDRMVLAIDPKYNILSFDELRRAKPAIRIATSTDDGTNFIGRTATAYLMAHGIDQDTLTSWGGSLLTAHRPEQALAMVMNGEADALLQEAIMTPWWRKLIEERQFVPLEAEESAPRRFADENPGAAAAIPSGVEVPAGFWKPLTAPLKCLDFSDFLIVVREDLPEDVAYLLTWCLVEAILVELAPNTQGLT